MIYYGLTDIGKVRQTNQDSYAIKKLSDDVLAAIVCDGMGGARGGNIASETAIRHFLKSLEDKNVIDPAREKSFSDEEITAALAHAVYDANEAVYRTAIENSELFGMGTTLVACIIHKNKLYAANVGDSRLYIDSGRKLTRISHDHSYVQFLIDVGDITPAEAKTHPYRNRITRAVGIQPDVDSDIFTVELEKYPKAKILLCSDGLCGLVDERDIHRILSAAKFGTDPESLCRSRAVSLKDAALKSGGTDNITVVLIETE